MGLVRGLLVQGNRKVGDAIHLFGLPAVTTCPGRTLVCEGCCYALRSRFRFQSVKDRLAWNLEQIKRDDFCGRMTKEIRRKGCLVLRVHSSGDFFNPEYAEKWLWIMKKVPKPRYYWYSRSWRIAEIAEVLEKMAALKQVRGWHGIDSETGTPQNVPKGIRTAYLQVDEDTPPEQADLVFRVRRLRKLPR
ncbi:GP88 family protein, partial [Zavarzinella formosa]|uniref:GP88 family protein n=1 Tax=Zavarzinella formosa TaxID=360055 RepID=UPI001EE6615C